MDIEELEGGAAAQAGETESLAQEGDALGEALTEAIRGGREEEQDKPEGGAAEEAQPEVAKEGAAEPKPEPEGKDSPSAAASRERQYQTTHWPAQYKAAYEKAPDELKPVWAEQVKALETKWHTAEQERHQWRSFGEPIAKLMTPERQRQLQSQNLTHEQGFKYLLDMNDFFARDPKAYIKHVMDYAKLQPADVFDGATQGQSEEWQDPETQQLRQEINDLRQQLGKQQYDRDYQTGLQQAQKRQEANQLLAEFAQAPGDDGRPAYPHYSRVAPRMTYLINQDPDLRQMPRDTRLQKLELMHEAYNRAVRLDPELYEGELHTYAEKVRREEDAKREAERAKRAMGLRSPGTGDGSSASSGDLDGIMRDVWTATRAAR